MLFSSPVPFEVPVLPRVKKFLSVQLDHQPLPLTPDISGPTSILKTLRLQLWTIAQSQKVRMYYSEFRRQAMSRVAKRERLSVPPELTDRLTICVTEVHNSRQQELFNICELLAITELVQLLILFDYEAFMSAHEGTIREVTRQWVDQYDFSDEDIREEALWQHWLRLRKGQGESSLRLSRFNEANRARLAA